MFFCGIRKTARLLAVAEFPPCLDKLLHGPCRWELVAVEPATIVRGTVEIVQAGHAHRPEPAPEFIEALRGEHGVITILYPREITVLRRLFAIGRAGVVHEGFCGR
jgi:hypothetical protein